MTIPEQNGKALRTMDDGPRSPQAGAQFRTMKLCLRVRVLPACFCLAASYAVLVTATPAAAVTNGPILYAGNDTIGSANPDGTNPDKEVFPAGSDRSPTAAP